MCLKVAKGRGALDSIDGELDGVLRLAGAAKYLDAPDMAVGQQFDLQHRNGKQRIRRLAQVDLPGLAATSRWAAWRRSSAPS